MPSLLKLFQKITEGGTLPNSFYEATITLIPKPDKDATKKRKLQANITDEHRCKNPQQSSSKQNSTNTEKLIHHDQIGFIPWMKRFFNICKSISVIHHINKLKDENHNAISIDAEKAFDKNQHILMIKIKKKKGPRKNLPQNSKGHI